MLNVGPNLATKIGSSKCDYREHLPQRKSHNSFFLRRTDEREVTNIIKILKPKTSCGHDDLSPKV